jgi:lysophospholipase L1-like esterase
MKSVLVLVAALCLFSTACLFAEPAPKLFGDKVCLRGGLPNARIAFERTGKGTVAFLGGSITEMNGYRPMVCEILQKRFPKTAFTFIPAGISSTCSTTGAFRFGSDVLAKGPVDLLFVEFAVNDDQDGHHTREECVRGMEGILRQARQANPAMDIVMTFFVNEQILETLQKGKVPLTVEAHAAVAEYYAVPTIHLAKEVAEQIAAGSLTWKQFGGVHPAPHGNAICARMIDELFSRAWASPAAEGAVPAPVPLTPLDPFSYGSGRFVSPAAAQVKQGWSLGVPDWKALPGGKRDRFTSIPMLCATEPGAELSLAFEGTAVGAYIVAGPDAGVAEASIDGGPFAKVNLCHAYSKGLHYPRTVMFATALPRGAHTLTLRLSAETQSAGYAARIMQFTAN